MKILEFYIYINVDINISINYRFFILPGNSSTLKKLSLLRKLYNLSPSIKMLSKCYDFQMETETFLKIDQHTANNTLHSHYLLAVYPKGATFL